MKNNVFEKARQFTYRNARPVDLALWKYLFEGGKRSDVVDALECYQNADGGFGHGIEPDFWNVNSTPMATWQAIGVLKEIGVDPDEQIVKNVFKYLDSGKDFKDGLWLRTVPSNNDHPRAVWWHYNEDEPCVNPSVSLAGFVLRYAPPHDSLYDKAVGIVKNAVSKFMAKPDTEMHTLNNFIELYEYCRAIDGFGLFDLDAFKAALCVAVDLAVCKDTDKWIKEYVCLPSSFYNGSKTIFDLVDRELCLKEGKMLLEAQGNDGAYPVPWLWYNDYTEYHVSANMWKSIILRKNVRYLKDLGLI
ncbi:MAG: hypothetical protein K2M48_02645 [Clostridiales bacterium]|nr:hypothetical protein [Clostridiales bacterium]